MPSRRSASLPAPLALALGALQGPTELVPVSSSAHVTLLAWLLDSDYAALDDELRKAFEVALHAGTALALLVGLRAEVAEAARSLDRRRLGVLGAATLPPALVGYALERPIESRLGGPGTIAVGLLAGAAALAVGDRAPQRRAHEEATPADGLWLGAAQACALFPGVSRSGATLAVARRRGFRRPDAGRLSREVAVPVIAGAVALKGLRLVRRGLPEGAALPIALGAGAAFASTLASRGLVAVVERDRPLAWFAAYRAVLAGGIGWRLRGERLPRG
ncbi:MAG TPA: undecaprenyl-diphosphate phosphatase [Solirubrobacteraceae bacterium]|nr:undecaprenyl-diphosphate phosphatase [Solirubrobacteraceae bacterium]